MGMPRYFQWCQQHINLILNSHTVEGTKHCYSPQWDSPPYHPAEALVSITSCFLHHVALGLRYFLFCSADSIIYFQSYSCVYSNVYSPFRHSEDLTKLTYHGWRCSVFVIFIVAIISSRRNAERLFAKKGQ